MRGIVRAEVGNRLDASGGPGKFVGHLVPRFKPECAYTHYEKREIVLVVDPETLAQQAEFMILWSRWFGNYTEMTPASHVGNPEGRRGRHRPREQGS